ncbi:hypothetical protein [Dyella sp.]|uniref:hypothetical protein n=1 Tax=Dyella sp. TaxID=1869338 RepID=UPI002FD8B5A1
MTVQKLLVLNSNGMEQQYTPITSSAGSSSAGQIPALGAGGQLDASFIPSTTGSMSAPATEAIAAGAAVNIYNNAGTISLRNANATDATKPCNGFAPSAIASGSSGMVNFPGQLNSGVSGLTPSALVFLGTTAGQFTSTPPNTTGNLVQPCGYALTATEMLHLWSPGTIC